MVIKTDALAVAVDDHEFDLEWSLLLDMSETMQKLSALAGVDPMRVVLRDGLEIRIEDRNPQETLIERLTALLVGVKEVVSASGMDCEEACRAILKGDGWSWTSRNLRAPLWMWNHEEVSRCEVANEFEELKWLEKSMLEIK